MISETDIHLLQTRLIRINQKARISQQRWITGGSLATLAWICAMTRLPPLQQSRSILPHLIMCGLAYLLSNSLSNGLQKANRIEKTSQTLSKCLKRIKSDREYQAIYRESINLQRQYPD